MSLRYDPPAATEVLSITEVERQTGIRPATLRMWEKRYGFPQPLRDQHGDRVYPLNQVERLAAARRLMAQGIRPGKIFSGGVLPDTVNAAPAGALPRPAAGPFQPMFELLRAYRIAELHSHFQYRLLNLGLRRFVIEFLAPLSTEVGLAWGRGELPVRCEHLYSELAKSILHARQEAVRSGGGRGPTALLATLTGESHVLGILMAEAILASLEVQCIQLGSELPPQELAAAASETGADIVALSFSAYFPRRDAARMTKALCKALPPSAELWVGGDGASEAAALARGVYVFDSLAAIEPALLCWHARHRAG